MHLFWNLAKFDAARSLQQDGLPLRNQAFHQGNALPLCQRFSPRDLHKGNAVLTGLLNHVVYGEILSACKGVFRVTPATAQVASGEPQENTQLACMGPFALMRRIHLRYSESLINRDLLGFHMPSRIQGWDRL